MVYSWASFPFLDSEKLEEDIEFQVIGNPEELKKAQEEQAKAAETAANGEGKKLLLVYFLCILYWSLMSPLPC